MGFEYALVHLKYTIPPAVILTYFYRGISTRLDVYRVAFLVSIAVISTIPWDSYLIRQQIWTYPPHVIVGPKLFDIPAEELFFFVIQAYNTSILYLFLSKTVTHAAYLLPAQRSKSNDDGTHEAVLKHGIFAAMAAVISFGAWMTAHGGQGTYLGLILVWAGPFALLLWGLSGYMIQRLPLSATLLPIALPTLYLWIVDTMALRRGTWVITSGTKLGIYIWRGLEVEEAIFFLATNTLVVFGLVAFDHAMAVLDANSWIFPRVAATPSPALLIRALMLRGAQYDHGRIYAIRDAAERLRRKSRSFHLASAFFSGRTRIDLMLLYSFCRAADDLVDDAKTSGEASEYVAKLREYLDAVYGNRKEMSRAPPVLEQGVASFPENTRSALLHVPAYLPSAPLYRLLDGFETDLGFNDGTEWPIQDEAHLSEYAACVAGTVAELCIELILHNTNTATPTSRKMHRHLVTSGRRMGIALQYVNVARDISVDAAMNRVYLPTTWLAQQKLKPDDVLADPTSAAVLGLREKLLDEADGIYRDNRDAIDALPGEVRGPMRVAVESYMEIGRMLRGGEGEGEGECRVRAGRATVPVVQRVRVGWRALHA